MGRKQVKHLTCTALTTMLLLLSTTMAKAAGFNGAFLGLQLGSIDTKVDVKDNGFFRPIQNSFDRSIGGVSEGIFAGYRMTFDRLVLGIEADGTLSNADSKTLQYNGFGFVVDTKFTKRNSFGIGPRVGYLVSDKVLGFLGVDYTRGTFERHETINGAFPLGCSFGVCSNGSNTLNGFRFGGGVEVAATDNFHMRIDFQHTNWQSKSFTDVGGGTATINPSDNTARLGLIYALK